MRRLLWAGPVATAAAILATLLYYTLTKAFGEQYQMPLGVDPTLTSPMPAIMPILAVLVPGLLASGFFGFLLRFSRKPATIFVSVASAALILAMAGPFSLPEAAMRTKVLLCGMQILAGGVITAGILLLSHQKTKVP